MSPYESLAVWAGRNYPPAIADEIRLAHELRAARRLNPLTLAEIRRAWGEPAPAGPPAATAPGKAPAYCTGGFCPPNEQQLTDDERDRGHLCDECADELDSRERDAFHRRYH